MAEGTTGPRFFAETAPGRRGEILDAALAVFDEKGFEGGTMREIAERVGFSEPALYRHFASKDALFTDVVTLATERFLGEARQLSSTLDPRDLRGSLRAILLDRAQALSRYMPLARVLVSVAVRREDYRALLASRIAAPLRDNWLAVVPRIDEALGLAFSAEETESRVRAYISLFIGWHITSTLMGETDPAVAVDAMLRVMRWDEAAV